MRMIKYPLVGFFAVFCLGSSCPSPESFPPPPLPAPSFSKTELTAARFDSYRPAVHLEWTTPNSDSLSIHEFVILEKSSDSGGFSVLVRSIPDSITSYFDNLDRIVFPQLWDIRTIQYRIYAIDTLGRSGDTSAIDSFSLAWPPEMVSPIEADTVLWPDSLVWNVSGVMSGYFTYVYLFSDSGGCLWQSPRPGIPVYSDHDKTVRFAVAVPGSLPLPSGGPYFWGAKVEIPTGSASSIAISRFYVR
jgi:hypothetical protein